MYSIQPLTRPEACSNSYSLFRRLRTQLLVILGLLHVPLLDVLPLALETLLAPTASV
jgi:hypothetical protein